MSQQLKELRSQIDFIDDKIIQLLEDRIQLVKNIRDIKHSNNLDFKDSTREEEVLNKTESKAIRKVFRAILDESLKSMHEY